MRIYKGENGRQFRRVSRWIKIKTDFVTVRHSLAEYGDRDGDGVILSWFRHNGKRYALGQFQRFGTGWAFAPPMFENEDGKTSFMSGFDCTEYYKPYLIEIDDGGEYVRLFEEVEQ